MKNNKRSLAVAIAAAVAFLSVLAVLGSCASTVKQNLDARANLFKCEYALTGVEFKDVKFGGGFIVDSVLVDVLLKITNKADSDVAVDHVTGRLSLDQNDILGIAHDKFTRIPVAASAVERIAVEIPFSGIMAQIDKRPQTIGVKTKVWITILIGKETWETPVVIPLEITVPIPYDSINGKVEQQKQRQANDEAAKAAAETAKKTAEAAAKAAKAAAEETARQAALKAAEAAAKTATEEAARKAAEDAAKAVPKISPLF